MHSFAVIAGFVAAANAAAYGYTAQNTTSVAPPTYGASSSAAAYQVSSAVGYPSYTTTTIKGLTTVCPEATTLKVGSKTYTVTKSTTIIDNDCEYTTTVPVKATATAVYGSSAVVVVKASSAAVVQASSGAVVKASSAAIGYSAVPVVSSPSVPYPSSNGTATYVLPTGATPSSTKPAASQFTGAAAQTGAAMLAIVGAVAAFL